MFVSEGSHCWLCPRNERLHVARCFLTRVVLQVYAIRTSGGLLFCVLPSWLGGATKPTHFCTFIFRASFAEAAMSLVLRLIASRRQYKITFFLSAARVDNKFRRSLRHKGVESCTKSCQQSMLLVQGLYSSIQRVPLRHLWTEPTRVSKC